jgi:hypothetical protein
MSLRIEDLRGDFRPLAEKFIAELSAAKLRFIVTCTTRTAEEQADCFARGASKCDGYKKISPHQLGIAIDVVPLDEHGYPTWSYARYQTAYKRIALIARKCGLESGQDWKPIDPDTGLGWDPPHYQLP